MDHKTGYGHGYGYHEHGCGSMGYGGTGGMKKSHHHCPVCGMPHGMEGPGPMKAGGRHHLAQKAVKKLLLEKMKAKIDERWGDKLDEIAQELVDMAEEKMKLKKEIWNRKKAVKERMHEILTEEPEEEE